jgi:hypothetical protein
VTEKVPIVSLLRAIEVSCIHKEYTSRFNFPCALLPDLFDPPARIIVSPFQRTEVLGKGMRAWGKGKNPFPKGFFPFPQQLLSAYARA